MHFRVITKLSTRRDTKLDVHMGAVSHADSDVVAYWWLTGVFTGVCRIATPLDFPALSCVQVMSLLELNFLLSPLVGHLIREVAI